MDTYEWKAQTHQRNLFPLWNQMALKVCPPRVHTAWISLWFFLSCCYVLFLESSKHVHRMLKESLWVNLAPPTHCPCVLNNFACKDWIPLLRKILNNGYHGSRGSKFESDTWPLLHAFTRESISSGYTCIFKCYTWDHARLMDEGLVLGGQFWLT